MLWAAFSGCLGLCSSHKQGSHAGSAGPCELVPSSRLQPYLSSHLVKPVMLTLPDPAA